MDDAEMKPAPRLTSRAARELSKLGAAKGGEARAKSLSAEERSEIARKAVEARWAKTKPEEGQLGSLEGVEADATEGSIEGLPEAKYKGFLNILDLDMPCYVLDNGQRVIGRTSATEMLTAIKGGGDLEKYLGVASLK